MDAMEAIIAIATSALVTTMGRTNTNTVGIADWAVLTSARAKTAIRMDSVLPSKTAEAAAAAAPPSASLNVSMT
jgi:hypothetical protein